MTRRSARLFFAVSICSSLLLAGCVSFGNSPLPVPAGVVEPWKLPGEAFPGQRLYRLSYDGPEGKLDFKLTVYLSSPVQYRLQATHGLGRRLWELDIDAADRVLWVDHREVTYCRAEEAGLLVIVPVARLPLGSLPKLLLGRLPAAPVSELAQSASEVSFRDGLGRRWSARLLDGGRRLEWWTLEEDGEPVAWWRAEEDGGVFSDRRGKQQLRWRLSVAEALSGAVPALVPPAGYREVSCTG